MDKLLVDISRCTLCHKHLQFGPRPVVAASPSSKIAIIGQAPGAKVHKTGIPWDDASGNQLREWLQVTTEQFYDPTNFALIPMGFCYPGKGKSGDLPPRPECAPKWHNPLFESMAHVQLILLIGQYAQQYYLEKNTKNTLTETVQSYKEYLPHYLPLPHPSPRNNIWQKKNPWFRGEVVPELQKITSNLL